MFTYPNTLHLKNFKTLVAEGVLVSSDFSHLNTLLFSVETSLPDATDAHIIVRNLMATRNGWRSKFTFAPILNLINIPWLN